MNGVKADAGVSSELNICKEREREKERGAIERVVRFERRSDAGRICTRVAIRVIRAT